MHDATFSRFLLKNTLNKKYLLIAMAGIFIQFTVFKLCYPFADFFTDSYTYIYDAARHHTIGIRPLGYARFLALIHSITTSDTALVLIQYLCMQAGLLLLFFTASYLFPVRTAISHVLFIMLIFDPVTLYFSNYVTSDAIFFGISLIWFTLLLWLINRPAWNQLIIMACLLYCLFNIRYAALYLPAVAILALLFSRSNWLFRSTGIVLVVAPMLLGIQHIKNLTQKETGTAIFSAFGSWTATNNVLHMYPYIDVQDKDLPSDCIAFNKIVKQYFDTLPVSARPYPHLRVDYIWQNNSPLKTYMYAVQQQKKTAGYFNAWHAVAPVFSRFSTSLVLKHPVAFMHYFMWPNTKEYCLPPLESFLAYNGQQDTVDATAVNWFRYKNSRVTCINKTIQGTLLQPMPWLFLLVNIIFCIAMILLIARANYYRLSGTLRATLLLAGGFWFINCCFSIYASPIVFRYQYFPMIIFITFSMLMINALTTRYYNKPASTT